MSFRFDNLPTISIPVQTSTFNDDDPGHLPKEQYDALWAAFGKAMEKVPQGKTRSFKGRVTKVVGPVPIADIYQGQGKIRSYFLLTCVLTAKGLEGLTFSNVEIPMSLNEKAKFNHLYYAVTGEAPEGENMAVNPGIVTVRDVYFKIKKEGPRKDGKRGGHWFKVNEFDEIPDAEFDNELSPDAWREATPEELEKYTVLAELSMAAGKRVRRLPENMLVTQAPQAVLDEDAALNANLAAENEVLPYVNDGEESVDESDIPWE